MDEKQSVNEWQEPRANPPAGSLLRGLLIVRTLIDAPAPLALVELAERTGLDSSTVLRLAQVLVDEGYLVRQNIGKRYCAGPRAISLLSPYHPINSFRRETSELLQQLRDDIGETVATVVFLGAERLIVDIVQGREALAPFYETWLRTPLHASASGRVLLGALGPKQRREVLGPDPLPAITPHTVTRSSELEAELSIARAQGYVVSRNDMHVGLTAVAAPIEHAAGTVGCLVTVGSSIRLTEAVCEHVGIVLRDTARLIGAATPSVRFLSHFIGA